ncbi:MAG TPA: CBS domain-containing protein [Nitrososphaeraceae archaeon]|jgi:CBS domain-containing protein
MNKNTAHPGEVIPVSDFMTANVVTAIENQSASYVCKLMCNRKVGSIVILKNIKESKASSVKKKETVVEGIVTERDYLHLIGFSDMINVDIPISEIMSKPLITIRKSASINDAISTMQAKNIRRLPVLDNSGKMIGIITDKDILRAIMTNQSLAMSLLADPTLLVDQHSLFSRYTSNSWFRDICPTEL